MSEYNLDRKSNKEVYDMLINEDITLEDLENSMTRGRRIYFYKNYEELITETYIDTPLNVLNMDKGLYYADSLNNKLKEYLSSQLETKANLNSVFSMANMGQDVKEAMTGGSVAVVGKDTVLTENIVDGQVTLEKTELKFVDSIKNMCNKLSNNLSLINKEVSNTINEAGYFKFIDDSQISTNNITFEKGKKYKYAISFVITNSSVISTNEQSVYLKLRNSVDMTFIDGVINKVNMKNGIVTLCNEFTIPTSATTLKYAPYIQLTNLGSESKTLTFKLLNIAIIEDSSDIFNAEIFTSYINPTAYPLFNYPSYFDKYYKNETVSIYNILDLIGDSLTQLTNGVNYQQYLQPLLPSFTMNNYGSGGEKANTISARCGGLKYLIEPCVLKTTGTSVNLLDNRYAEVNIRSSRDYEEYYINRNGEDIKLTIEYGSTPYQNPYIIKSPFDMTITKPTLVTTKFMKQDKKGHIAIICIGQNGGINTEMDLVYQIQNIIKYNNYKKYIVISSTTNIDIANKRQLEYFGENFLDAKTYMIKYGLSEMGIPPTSQDTTDIANNLIPTSLRSDNVHYNAKGCELLANLIYRKGQELMYW